MIDENALADLQARLENFPYFSLAQLPTPIQPLRNFSASLKGPELWMKRDDLTGLEGGGNKTRKLEFLVGEALQQGHDMLVTVGAIQSNHTRQTAAAAARAKLKCALLHCAWTRDAGPNYRTVGNVLLSHVMGAELYVDEAERPIEDQGPLDEFIARLKSQGHRPYLIPAGGSEHRLGSMGYVKCAAEIAFQSLQSGIDFDYLVHCSGSSGTQAGLLAGFRALGMNVTVVGVSDDGETRIKAARVQNLANETLQLLEYGLRVDEEDVSVISASDNAYGDPDASVLGAIEQLARTEGLVADPVYEGRAIRGLMNSIADDRFEDDARVLLMHLGGAPAIHAYAEQFPPIRLQPFGT